MLPEAMLQSHKCGKYLSDESEVAWAFEPLPATPVWPGVHGCCVFGHSHHTLGPAASLVADASMAVRVCFRHGHDTVAEV